MAFGPFVFQEESMDAMKSGSKSGGKSSVKAGPIKVMGAASATYKSGKGKKSSLKKQAKKVSFK
jgi:hypothetical protein